MRITFVKRRMSYRLTFIGWFSILCLNLIVVFLFIKLIASFLVVNSPVQSKVLVVDGLLPGYAYDTIVQIVKRDKYVYLITTGVDVDYTYNASEQFNIAEFSFKVLSTKDLGTCKLFKAPAHHFYRDRTYSSAATLRLWFIEKKIFPVNINVVSFSCHSRRTWNLYKKAFYQFAHVGIIAIADQTYDYNTWYKNSKGVRQILSETIGYIYTTVLFHPKVKTCEDSY